MDDKTIYKRHDKGKKISKNPEKTTFVKFKDRYIDIEKTIKIGRDKINEIVIEDDPLVSRVHAIIEKSGTGYRIKDNNSTNGTYVNNNPLQKGKTQVLSNGDTVKVGNTKLEIV